MSTSAEHDETLLGSGSRFDASLVAHYWDSGQWNDVALGSYLDDAVKQAPEQIAAVSVDDTGAVTRTLTYSELDTLSRQVAAGLQRLGVGPGDTVSVMFPNCAEFSAVVFAILRLGARYSGIPSTYGRREVSFMLGRAQTRVLVLAAQQSTRDLVTLAQEARGDHPELEHIVVFGGPPPEEPGWLGFDELVDQPALHDFPHVPPFSLAQLAFTSGTTSEPKAVMNLHTTLDAVITNWVDHIGEESLGSPVVNLVMSPVGHSTGFFWGALMTTRLVGTAVYLERWRPETGLRVLREQQVTTMVGSPTFLMDILRLDGATSEQLPDLRLIAAAGAPIPRSLVPNARARLKCAIVPAWGMTEYGIGVSASPMLPCDRVEATDGRPVRGCGVRVCGPDGIELPPEQEGDLQICGAGLFAGYYGRPDFTADSFTADGWFRTGDRAVLHEDGYVSLRGRTKDIVIRGGENIPIIDIESLLYQHPQVAEVAVIGIPDDRLGERACAVVAPKDKNWQPDLGTICQYLLAQGLSKRFLPEELVVVDELPKTMSGKVRKVDLRERLSRGVA